MNQFEEIVERARIDGERRLQKMEDDNQKFRADYRWVIQEWRRNLYNYILVLGGIMSLFLAILSSGINKQDINNADFIWALKILLFSLGFLVSALIYSINKDREIMWGSIWIKNFSFGTRMYEKYSILYKAKKFLWIFAPKEFSYMDGLTEEQKKNDSKSTGKKYSYFADFKRRWTDFKVLVYVTRLNDGVWNYHLIFGLLSLSGIGLSFYGLYELISLFA